MSCIANHVVQLIFVASHSAVGIFITSCQYIPLKHNKVERDLVSQKRE